MTTGGFSPKRLARLRDLLEGHVDSGFVPGAVAVLARHGDVRIEGVSPHAPPGPKDEHTLQSRGQAHSRSAEARKSRPSAW